MSKVVNIGILIRNEQGDTFPVALTPQMVSVIQNLLMQIPVLDSKLVDPSGKKLASKQSIPIIPREIEFDWEKAYTPMDRELELALMKKLTEKYQAMDESESIDGVIPQNIEGAEEGKIVQLHPDRKDGAFNDPENPFNLELEASGKANEDMTDAEVEQAVKENDQKIINEAKYPDPLAEQEKQQDVTVTPPALSLNGETPSPSGE